MPYSCWMTATSLWFSNSAHAATDGAEPLTSSPTTRVLEDGGPSDTRTTLTSAPLAVNPWARAALNVAGPYGVGGYVLRMPKLGVSENLCPPGESVKHGNLNKVLKVSPTEGGHLRARCPADLNRQQRSAESHGHSGHGRSAHGRPAQSETS